MSFESIERMIRDTFETEEFIRHNQIGIHLLEQDHVQLSMSVAPFQRNHHGMLHGGFMVMLADTAAGLAAYTDGRRYVTQSQNFTFLRAAAQGPVIADARVVHRGGTVVVLQTDVTDPQGKLVGTGTFQMYALKTSAEN